MIKYTILAVVALVAGVFAFRYRKTIKHTSMKSYDTTTKWLLNA